MKAPIYSVFWSYVALFFSVYSSIQLFLIGSIFWPLIGFSAGFFLFSIKRGISTTFRFLYINNLNSLFSLIFRRFLSSIMFLSSTYGAIAFLISLDLLNNYYSLPLILVLSILNLGVSVGVYQLR